MANNTNVIMHPDDRTINMSDAWQVLWWCRYLGLTKSELEAAIHAAGAVIEDIKCYLTRQQSLKAGIPPAKSPAGTCHISSRKTQTRLPF